MAPAALGLLLALALPLASRAAGDGAGTCPSAAGCADAEDELVSALQAHLRDSGAWRPSKHGRKKPNIALVYFDQVRWDYVGYDEPPVHMPNLHRLASQGTRFERAYVPSPLCVPSRCAFAAGRDYKNMWVRGNDYNYVNASANSTPTFMSLLREAGYTTIMAGKDHLSAKAGVGENSSIDATAVGFDIFRRSMDKYEFCAVTFGVDEQASAPIDQYGVSLQNFGVWDAQCAAYGPYARGFACNETQVCEGPSSDQLECGFRCTRRNQLDASMSIDEYAERQAEALLSGHWALHGKEKPWFLQLGFPSPHPPFILTEEQAARTAKKGFPEPIDADFDSSDSQYAKNVNMRESQQDYAGLLEMLDEQLGRFLHFLRENRAYDDTVLVFLSDHGEHLGDHTEYSKSSAWEESVHVPLVVAGPGVQRQVVEQPVATLDMVATMLELAGTRPLPEMDSVSLLPVLTSRHGKPPREVILSGLDSAEGFDGRVGGFESAAKQFNATSFLRLVCCLTGCIKQGTMLPVTSGPQVALMHVTPGEGAAKYEHDVLNKPPGRGVAEAMELAQHMSQDYRQACLPLLRTAGEPL